MMNGVLAQLMQAMKAQAQTAGYDDDGPQMPNDQALMGAFGQPPVDTMGQSSMSGMDAPGADSPAMWQDGGLDGGQPQLGGDQDFPLEQEAGDLWGPQQPQMAGMPQGAASLQAMFGSPAMGGRMTTK